MFDTLHRPPHDAGYSRRWAVSLVLSAFGYAGLLLTMTILGGAAESSVEKLDEAVLVEIQKLPEPEPEPPPLEAPPPKAALVSAPKHLKRKLVAEVKPPPEIKAPEEIPDKPAPESDEEDAVEAAAPGEGDATGLEGGDRKGKGTGKVASLVPAPPREAPPKPVMLPENASPPQPLDDNALPVYPPEMKAAGTESTVILKVIIDHLGRVTAAKVMKGEEPFASAALAAVKSWRYRPAVHEGRPIAVFTIVKIPFKLKFGD
jgi:protein TonB